MNETETETVNSAGVSNKVVMRHLGKDVNYPTSYDPSVLVREPRETNRVAVGIDPVQLPFKGHDVWHLWEMTCINGKSLEPEVAIFKISYPATSKYIVESKSIKLYTFSFNNETYENGLQDVATIMSNDLSKLLEAEVTVTVYSAEYEKEFTVNNKRPLSFDEEFLNVDKNIETNNKTRNVLLSTQLLRSLCRVTSQPDMGDCYYFAKFVDEVNLSDFIKKFKEVVLSYRNQNHFHEESCEGIFKQMYDFSDEKPYDMGVFCLYTRRGGIDINPFRYYTETETTFTKYELLGKTELFKTTRQ